MTTTDVHVRGLNELARDLKGFVDRKEILKQLRTEMRAPMPEARQRVKAAAQRLLPSRGGLGAYVAGRLRLTAQIRVNGSSSRLTIKGSRPKAGGMVDLRRIDAGRLRHPTYGHAPWVNQTVSEGFASNTLTEEMADRWRRTVDDAVAKAVRSLG